MRPTSPLRHGSQQGSVLAPSVDAELLRFHAHLTRRAERQRDIGTFLQGARDLLGFLAASGKTVSAFTAGDLAAFEQTLHPGEAKRTARWSRPWLLLEGARAYLRFKLWQGQLPVDEELFFSLSPRITAGVVGSAEGQGRLVLLVRELEAFGRALLACRLGKLRRWAYERAALKLLFFLARAGKDASAITLDDWVRFRDEVKTRQARRAGLLLAGARAYLESKLRAGALRQEQLRRASTSRPWRGFRP